MHTIFSSLPAASISTAHAAKRGQQRGISHHHSSLVFNFADIEQDAGGGLVRLRLSSAGIRELTKERVCTAQEADRLARLTIITDGIHVVTQYRTH